MTENRKKRVAAFRFGGISNFVNAARLEHGERERLPHARSACRYRREAEKNVPDRHAADQPNFTPIFFASLISISKASSYS